MRKEKGITLIALIITIILLLILASVLISSIRNDKILSHVENTENKYYQTQSKYNNLINDQLDYLKNELNPNVNNNPSNDNEDNASEDEEDLTLGIGSYIEYDLPYTDICTGTEYTKTNGWRYIGTDNSGNKLIISTGIPAYIDTVFDKYVIDGITGWTPPEWWATENELKADTGVYKSSRLEHNRAAGYGLRYKFEEIPFNYLQGTIEEYKNLYVGEGLFKKVGNTTSGEGVSLNFRATGVNVIDVHNITLAEIQEAIFEATGDRLEKIEDQGTMRATGKAIGSLSGKAKGLFHIGNEYVLTEEGYTYIALRNLCVNEYGYLGHGGYFGGLRPVITLAPSVELKVVG